MGDKAIEAMQNFIQYVEILELVSLLLYIVFGILHLENIFNLVCSTFHR